MGISDDVDDKYDDDDDDDCASFSFVQNNLECLIQNSIRVQRLFVSFSLSK